MGAPRAGAQLILKGLDTARATLEHRAGHGRERMSAIVEAARRVPNRMSAEEWRLRVELAACYRIFDFLGWIEMIYNHITVRVPGPSPQYLINPYGLNYEEVTARNLVLIDIEGNVLDGSAH